MKVRYYGHVHQSSGYGRAGRELCMALLAAGIDLEIRPFEATFPVPLPPQLAACVHGDYDLDLNPDAIIVHTLPMDCRKAAQAITGLSLLPTEPVLIAYTTWEGHDFVPTDVRQSLADFDQVWVPSSVTMEAFEREPVWGAYGVMGLDLHVVPHAFNGRLRARVPRPPPIRTSSSAVSFETPYRFCYVGAWTSRKNPAALVRAFVATFTNEDAVELRLHCSGTDKMAYLTAIAQTGVPQDKLPRLQFSNAPLSDIEISALYRSSDCFVTASRGEAWNLPAFEAMMADCHVISPRGLGSDDFLRETSADLGVQNYPAFPVVDVTVLGVAGGGVAFQSVGAQGLDGRCLWLEPDLRTLGKAMRQAYEQWTQGIEIRYDVEARYGYEAVGRLALNLLETACPRT